MTNKRQHFNETGRDQLRRLWNALYGGDAPRSVLTLFDRMVPPGTAWAGWPSDISDDHSPYEFSLVLRRDSTELRVMSEMISTGNDVSLQRTIQEGRAFSELLAREYGADFTRLEKVRDLFFPSDPQGNFAFWHAAILDPNGKDPSFKLYLNPQVRGKDHAPHLVEEMLCRLGFADAWSTVTKAARRGPELDEIRYVSLDAHGGDVARVKVYLFHHEATFDDLHHVASFAPGHEPAPLDRFLATIAGGTGLLRAARQAGTCLAFVGGKGTPKTCTVHLPIRAYAGNDEIAHVRIRRALTDLEIPTQPYERALTALARRPLSEGSGLHAWVGLCGGTTKPHVNVYLAPEAVATEPSHPTVFPGVDSHSPVALLRHYESHPITNIHPFLLRMEREPFDLGRMYLLLLNVREGITRDFSRRLAQVVARVEEDDIRSILAKQLNDELGDGNPDRMHKLLFDRFVEGLAPYGPSIDDGMLAPGRELGQLLERLYTQCDPYEGVGASLIMEVYGRQLDQFVGKLFRTGRDLPAPVMEWLTLHETLEVDHVKESEDIAGRIPRGWKYNSAARGAKAVGDAGWALLDAMYAVFFR
jgi:hypothetical protein